MWKKEMKEQILSLARATYTDSFSGSSVFDVIHTTRHFRLVFNLTTHYNTHLIVYKEPSTNGGLDFIITMEYDTVAQGLEALKEKLQDQLGSTIERAAEARGMSINDVKHYDSDGFAINAGTAIEKARYDRIWDALGDLWTVFRN